MDHLYGNGRKFTSFLLTGPTLVLELLQYYVILLVMKHFVTTVFIFLYLQGSIGISGLGSACDPGDPGLIPRHCCLLLLP